MTKYPVEIEGLPEGWEPVECMSDPNGSYAWDDNYRYLQVIESR